MCQGREREREREREHTRKHKRTSERRTIHTYATGAAKPWNDLRYSPPLPSARWRLVGSPVREGDVSTGLSRKFGSERAITGMLRSNGSYRTLSIRECTPVTYTYLSVAREESERLINSNYICEEFSHTKLNKR